MSEQPAPERDPLLVDLRGLASPTAPYRGSWDPFEDITDALDALGVVYCLTIATPGTARATIVSNVRSAGINGVEAFQNAANQHLDGIRARLEQ